jgi:hypothetical protein
MYLRLSRYYYNSRKMHNHVPQEPPVRVGRNVYMICYTTLWYDFPRHIDYVASLMRPLRDRALLQGTRSMRDLVEAS